MTAVDSNAVATITMDHILRDMVSQGASDLHLKAGNYPGFRVDGGVQPQTNYAVMQGADVLALAQQMMTQEQNERFERERDLDFSYAIPEVSRFRVNLLMQRGAPGIVIRQIPATIPRAEDLGLPSVCLDLASKPRGLVLVTGPTGSGKSTTLAALIDHVNESETGHILTMEDPIEFLHPDKKCFVTQRQIGADTPSFEQALRRALRQDPDVILIGEMRDLETISMAITAAETGHLVFGTLHTTSAISTVDRIIDVFPTDAQQQVRVQLSSTLQGVISQCLVPKIGGGRVAAQEILIASDGIRSLIREGKTAQMLNLLQTGKGQGMTTLENRLIELTKEGLITPDDAVAKANRPTEVRSAVGGNASGAAAPSRSSDMHKAPTPRKSRAGGGGQASRPGFMRRKS